MSYNANLKRWLASNTAGSTLVTVTEFTHPSFGSRYINDFGTDFSVQLENTSIVPTEFAAFTFTLPSVKNTTKQEMKINIDNTGGVPYSILNTIEPLDRFAEPIIVKVRFYLDSDLASPQLDPPIKLEVKSATADGSVVQFTCVTPYLRQIFTGMLYKANRFPTLYSFWT